MDDSQNQRRNVGPPGLEAESERTRVGPDDERFLLEAWEKTRGWPAGHLETLGCTVHTRRYPGVCPEGMAAFGEVIRVPARAVSGALTTWQDATRRDWRDAGSPKYLHPPRATWERSGAGPPPPEAQAFGIDQLPGAAEVHVVEGASDWITLMAHRPDGCAIIGAMGSAVLGAVAAPILEHAAGADVVIWPDADAAGWAGAAKLLRALRAAGRDADVSHTGHADVAAAAEATGAVPGLEPGTEPVRDIGADLAIAEALDKLEAEAGTAARAAATRRRRLREIADPDDAESLADEVKAATSLERLREYIVSLKHHPRPAHVGPVRCPSLAHEDRSPSCSLDLDGATAVWKCHAGACLAGGTIIDAVIVGEGLDTTDAVHRAADIAGVARRAPAPARTRPRTAATARIEDTPAETASPAASPATPDTYPEFWELALGRWALEAERATGLPAPCIISAAAAEAVARLHGWALRGLPATLAVANVGVSGSGKTRAARWARDRIAWPPAARWHTDPDANPAGDGASIARYAPESPEGLIDRIRSGRRPEPGTPEADRAAGEGLAYPAAIIQIDEGQHLWPERRNPQSEGTRRVLRTLISGEDVAHYRKDSADTPARIIRHKPGIAVIAAMTHEPAARLLADTSGDADRFRLTTAARLTTEPAAGEPPEPWEPPGTMSDPAALGSGPDRPAVRIPDEVRAEITEREHACQMAAREHLDPPEGGHAIPAELAAAAGLALLEHGTPHITAETWAAAGALTRAHRRAEEWIRAETAADRHRAAAGRGTGEAVARTARAERIARDDAARIDAAVNAALDHAAGEPAARGALTKHLAHQARAWAHVADRKPATLIDAVADALTAEHGWSETTGPAPKAGGKTTTWYCPPGTSPPAG